jgi:peptidoglycan/LPS O-acetylase OafA/YrhL
MTSTKIPLQAGPLDYRPDIDGLRAVAVLLVVGFHAFPSVFPGGFIGVDVFFVISGFLISSILFTSIQNGQFSFVDFYTRRINRIFPALVVVASTSYLIGWFALLPNEFEQLGKHIAGGMAFISNFILWNEVGYFDEAAEAKPLLHLWSLSIEEQFYVVWPLLIFLTWKKQWNFLPILMSIGVASFLFNVITIAGDPALSFYSPAARFWELMIGGALAYLNLTNTRVLRNSKRNLRSILGALLLGIGIATIDKDRAFPGWLALLPTFGAAFIISATDESWINSKILSNGAAVWFGKISYPLYLWHWPLLSFAGIMEQDTPSSTIRAFAVLISVILAWINYRIVEIPVRSGRRRSLKAACASVALIVIGSVGFITQESDGLRTRSTVAHFINNAIKWKEVQKAHASTCPGQLKEYVECYLFPDSLDADVLLVGDSHADHFVPGIANHNPDNLKVGALITNGGCPPLFGIERLRNGLPMENYGRKGAKCSEINEARLGYILNSSAKTVIISLIAQEYNSNKRVYEGGRNAKYAYQGVSGGNYDVFGLALKDTIKELVDAGKDIILVYDNPNFPFGRKLAACLQPGRPLSLPGSEKSVSCEISRTDAEQQQDAVASLYRELSQAFPSRVKIFDSLKYLCNRETCPLKEAGVVLYRDGNHLSYEGSSRLMKNFFEEFKLVSAHSSF